MSQTEMTTWDDHVRNRSHKKGVRMPLELVLLGLSGETGELCEKLLAYDEAIEAPHSEERDELLRTLSTDINLEAGDVLWYATAALHTTGLTVEDISFEAAMLMLSREKDPELTVTVGAVCDLVKKDLWHGKPYTQDAFVQALIQVLNSLSVIIGDFNLSLSDIAEANIEKLNKRYPLEAGGFVEGGGVR